MNRHKQSKLIYCIAVLFILAALSCKKSNSPKIITANATIINTGSVAADGCGWLVKIDGTDSMTYSPTNLTTAYQVDSLKVHITYQILTAKFACGDIPEPLNGGLTEIQINSISKSN